MSVVLAAIVNGQGTGQNSGNAAQILPVGTGLILGQVVDGVTGKPVGAALVTLNASVIAPVAAPAGAGVGARATTQTVITDAGGRFVFHELPKATYALTAEYTGYANGAVGQRRPGGPSQTIALDVDQRLTGVRIPLWKLASISGVVVDDNGDPMVGVSVRALRRTVTLGRRRFSPSSTATTDDRGAYRLSPIAPGDYVITIPATSVAAPISVALDAPPGVVGYRLGDVQLQLANPLTALAPPPLDGTKVVTYQTTFYPSTTAAAEAQTIVLGPGDERTGVDLQMRLVGTSRVSGTLTGPGDVVPGFALALMPLSSRDWSGDSGYETATTSPDAQGRFTFLGVPAGQYIVRGQRFDRTRDGASWWTESPVTVSAEDLTNVVVALHEGVRMSGRVEFEGTAPRPAADRLQQISITLVSADGRPAPSAMRVGADGQFVTLPHAPGKYTLNVSAPSGWFLKSVMAAGRDLSQAVFALEPRDVAGVVVTYTDRPAQLSGQVQGAQVPDLDALVVMFPANFLQTGDAGFAPRVMRSARPSRAGGFTLANVPAGEYCVAAVPDAFANDWSDEQVLARIARVASRISLADGAKQTITLSIAVLR